MNSVPLSILHYDSQRRKFPSLPTRGLHETRYSCVLCCFRNLQKIKDPIYSERRKSRHATRPSRKAIPERFVESIRDAEALSVSIIFYAAEISRPDGMTKMQSFSVFSIILNFIRSVSALSKRSMEFSSLKRTKEETRASIQRSHSKGATGSSRKTSVSSKKLSRKCQTIPLPSPCMLSNVPTRRPE